MSSSRKVLRRRIRLREAASWLMLAKQREAMKRIPSTGLERRVTLGRTRRYAMAELDEEGDDLHNQITNM